MQPLKAIIIGSGVAGMAAAIRLAVQGFDVAVYEKNSYPGGKLSSFKQDGYSFDAGPSLFTQPQHIEELFLLANEPIGDYFKYKPVDITCKYFFEDGKIINAYAGAQQFAEEMQRQLGEPAENVTRYLKNAADLYEKIGTIFLNHSLHKRSTWFNKRVINALSAVKYPYLAWSLDRHNRNKFAKQETAQLFNRFATYNGSNPYKAPAMLSLIPHLEQNQGVFFPEGGMISITNALFELAKAKGVKFYFNTAVQNIICHERKVKGVVVNNTNVLTNVVISNADIYFTYKQLLNDDAKAKKILKQERSSSAIIYYWGIKKSFPQLNLHNIFFSKDYKTEFDKIFSGKELTSDPTIYINITAKQEAGHAPSGKENWFVMINAPANTGQDWEELKIKLKANVIAKLSRILNEDIEALIETEHSLDPVLIEQQTDSYMGSLYGTSSNSKLAAFFRQANFTTAIKGLYFCGGSVHPGGGIPLCLSSAKITANLIQEAHKILKPH